MLLARSYIGILTWASVGLLIVGTAVAGGLFFRNSRGVEKYFLIMILIFNSYSIE